MSRDTYESPLSGRYASPDMLKLWSPDTKFKTWRQMWVALAQAQNELGLSTVSETQVQELRDHMNELNLDVAEAKEKEIRHDVMSHIYAFGMQCPNAKPIIHLGATSCFVTDNADLVILRKSLEIVRNGLIRAINTLMAFCLRYADLPTLGFTHFQPAQFTTVGKRASGWLQDLLWDYEAILELIAWLPLRGVKGTTGTQASFMALFNGDEDKVIQLDRRVAEILSFEKVVPVCNQTYPRKIDDKIMTVLSGIAQSCSKIATDMRLLCHLKEIEEPFQSSQVGSSAMAFKRNPMRSERICGLARFLVSLSSNTANTASNQWLERTLDDSANRRLVLPQAFLTSDAILILINNIIDGAVVNKAVINQHVKAELPFIATENILMRCVQQGGDRQQLHEAIRVHSHAVAKNMKENGAENDLLDRILGDELFRAVHDDIKDVSSSIMTPLSYIGRAPNQVRHFVDSIRDMEDVGHGESVYV